MIPQKHLVIILIFLSTAVQAQKRFLRRGDKAFVKKHYPEAIANYKQLEDKNANVHRNLAEAYYFMGDFEQSESYYQKLAEQNRKVKDLLALSRINVEKGNYPAAILMCENAVQAGADPVAMDQRIERIQNIAREKQKERKMLLQEIGIQPKAQSFGIAVFADQLVFSNLMGKSQKSAKVYQLVAGKIDSVDNSSVKFFAPKLEMGVDVGAVAFDPNGEVMYYTRRYMRKGHQQMEIVQAELKNGKWKAANLLTFNSKKYSCAYPALSKDGKKLYFSSDMPGGLGGMDLYVSHKQGNSWGNPIHLGAEINTRLDEIYPREMEQKLWFSSNGLIGFGKQDLFFAEKTLEGKWGSPQNAGVEYNSRYNDFCITKTESDHKILLVSDRQSKGVNDRFYSLQKDRKVKLEILVTDKSNAQSISGVTIQLHKVVNDQNLQMIEKEKGKFQAEISESELGKGILYQITSKKEGYKVLKMDFYPEISNLQFAITMQKLDEKRDFANELKRIDYPDRRIAFRNIYFDSNVNNLTEKAKRTLDKCAGFWKLHTQMHLILNSHSDSRGSAETNRILSMKRVQMAREYLVAKGVSAQMIEVNAYGEAYPVNACADHVECTEEEYAANRRIELIFEINE